MLSSATGYAIGLSSTKLFRWLRRGEVDSTVGEGDYVGATATVVLPVSKDKMGKVRMEVKGRTIELLATTEDEADLAANQSVIIYGLKDDGHVVVSRAEQLIE